MESATRVYGKAPKRARPVDREEPAARGGRPGAAAEDADADEEDGEDPATSPGQRRRRPNAPDAPAIQLRPGAQTIAQGVQAHQVSALCTLLKDNATPIAGEEGKAAFRKNIEQVLPIIMAMANVPTGPIGHNGLLLLAHLNNSSGPSIKSDAAAALSYHEARMA